MNWVRILVGALGLTGALVFLWAALSPQDEVNEKIHRARLDGIGRAVMPELEDLDLGGGFAVGQLFETLDLIGELGLDLETLAGPEPSRSRDRRAWRDARAQLEHRAQVRRLGSWSVKSLRTGAMWPPPPLDEAELLETPTGGVPATGMRYFARTRGGVIGLVSWTLLPAELGGPSAHALVEWVTLDSARWQTRIGEIERRLGWEPGTLRIEAVLPGSPSDFLTSLESFAHLGTLLDRKGGTLAHVGVPAKLLREPPTSSFTMLQAGLVVLWIAWLLLFVILETRGLTLDALTRRVERAAEAGHVLEPLGEGPGRVARLGRIIERAFASLSQEQIFRADAERRAAWEEVARRVAHEVKNPLTPIRLAVDNLQRASARGPGALEAALPEESAAIREEVRRLERLVNEFHEFARLPVPTFSSLDVVPLLREALEGQAGARDAVALRVEVPEPPPALLADPDLLVMAFTNLGRNAVQAMGQKGGTLRARVDVVDRGERVAIEIEDEGPGLAPEQLETIFEPYVTGREDGTGLGLAITRRIVASHGGSIEAKAAPGGGALFRVLLPVRGRSFTSQA